MAERHEIARVATFFMYLQIFLLAFCTVAVYGVSDIGQIAGLINRRLVKNYISLKSFYNHFLKNNFLYNATGY